MGFSAIYISRTHSRSFNFYTISFRLWRIDLRQIGRPQSLFSAARQLGEVRRHAPRLVANEQVGGCSSTRFVLEIKICQRLLVGILHDEARIIKLLDGPRR